MLYGHAGCQYLVGVPARCSMLIEPSGQFGILSFRTDSSPRSTFCAKETTLNIISLVFSLLPSWAQVTILVALLPLVLVEVVEAMRKIFPRHSSRPSHPHSPYRRVDSYQQYLLRRQLRSRRAPSRAR